MDGPNRLPAPAKRSIDPTKSGPQSAVQIVTSVGKTYSIFDHIQLTWNHR